MNELTTHAMLIAGGIGISAVYIYRSAKGAGTFEHRLSRTRQRATASGLAATTTKEERKKTEVHRHIGAGLVRMGSMLAPVGATERAKLADLLRRSGFGQKEALSVFLSIKVSTAVIGAMSAWSLAMQTSIGAQYIAVQIMATLVGFIIGGMVPEYGVKSIQAKRTRSMERALPDVLDLLVMCIETGLTIERGFLTVSEEMRPIEKNLAAELSLIEAELRLGRERRAVLQEVQRRSEVEGIKDMALTLMQSERFGTPLGDAMKNIAANQRLQRQTRIEAAAARLPIFISIPMLLMIVPGTMMLVAGPAFLTAIQTLGQFGGTP